MTAEHIRLWERPTFTPITVTIVLPVPAKLLTERVRFSAKRNTASKLTDCDMDSKAPATDTVNAVRVGNCADAVFAATAETEFQRVNRGRDPPTRVMRQDRLYRCDRPTFSPAECHC